MKRIILIGSGGAGKSTLARELGAALGIPVHHLDRIYWQPGWVETPRDEWIQIQKELLGQESWIIDGNYSATMDIRLEAADTIIFMDLPRVVCVLGALRRRVKYAGRSRPDMNPGCPEQLDWQFLKWIWEFPVTKRPGIEAKLKALEGTKQVIRLRSRREAARLLAIVKAGTIG